MHILLFAHVYSSTYRCMRDCADWRCIWSMAHARALGPGSARRPADPRGSPGPNPAAAPRHWSRAHPPLEHPANQVVRRSLAPLPVWIASVSAGTAQHYASLASCWRLQTISTRVRCMCLYKFHIFTDSVQSNIDSASDSIESNHIKILIEA